MTLTELNTMDDKEFSYKAAEMLNKRYVHRWAKGGINSHYCIRCGIKESEYVNGEAPCKIVPLTLDWNTAMPLLEESHIFGQLEIGDGTVDIDSDHYFNLFVPREVITAVLLARGLVEGE
jgi:hypothetical protein